MFKWIYDLTSNEFLYGGPYDPTFNPSTQGMVRLERNPNATTERYDGAGGMRPATTQEMSASDASQLIQQSVGRFDSEKLVKAVALWVAGKLLIPPATAKSEILTIYRGLP